MALTDNLVSYWKLDEASGTRVDSHGSNDLTDNNTVLSATGVINSGADLELSNSEYLSISNASQAGLGVTGDFSYSVWLKPEQLPATDMAIIDKTKWTGGRSGYNFSLYKSGSDMFLQYLIYSSSGSLTRGNTTNAFLTPSDVGNWVHLVVTVDISVPTITIYKNGSSVAVTVVSTAATSIGTNSVAFELGRYNGSSYFDGMFDEAGFWNRAIGSSEVTELYNGGAGLAYPFTGGAPVRNPTVMKWH